MASQSGNWENMEMSDNFFEPANIGEKSRYLMKNLEFSMGHYISIVKDELCVKIMLIYTENKTENKV